MIIRRFWLLPIIPFIVWVTTETPLFAGVQKSFVTTTVTELRLAQSLPKIQLVSDYYSGNQKEG
ncbi:hypothetical protein Lepto7375DRAFT_0006 [Leptolyngbya sp. PCC 7375]|nr:hypothetical protein Lepto7375DRAFT_0006 [Leptolyngbya sp. PCC 7375]